MRALSSFAILFLFIALSDSAQIADTALAQRVKAEGQYNVLCIAESALSLYQRLVQADCNVLASNFDPAITNVSIFLFDLFGVNTTQDLINIVNIYNPNMIIVANVLFYDPVKAVAPFYPNVWWLMTRIETKMNDIVPPNMLWLEFYEQIVWFLKGVLAAKFSASISTTNDFIIHVPMIEGLFVMPTNFYYAGLKYVNPKANLTAIVHGTFGRDASILVNISLQISPNYKVFAHFGSQTYYTGNLTQAKKYEIANTLSTNSPQIDYDVLINNVTTLAFNILNAPPIWKKIILDGMNGVDLTRRYDIILGNSIYLSDISPLVSRSTNIFVNHLAKKYLKSTNPLFCEPFISQIMKEIFPFPNGCVDPIHIVEGSLLHPKINIYSF